MHPCRGEDRQNGLPQPLAWLYVPQGRWFATLSLKYELGDFVHLVSGRILVRTSPELSLRLDP